MSVIEDGGPQPQAYLFISWMGPTSHYLRIQGILCSTQPKNLQFPVKEKAFDPTTFTIVPFVLVMKI